MGETILIVEDEKKIARFLELELQHEGYGTLVAEDGETGLALALGGQADLVVLDLMLPGMGGLAVLQGIRARDEQLPVILLTAKDDVADKVKGLDMGADDYMTKPFAMEEFLARIRVALKRRSLENASAKAGGLSHGQLHLDEGKRQASYGGIPIELTKKEYELLKYLLENKNMALPRERILEKVWGYDYYGDTNVIDVYVRYLRAKIDQKLGVEIIRTVRGVGYGIYD
ncbi:response regulator transcription factor [Anaerotalea alkaliphila]|uniref:Stage 0 sporulation protein A homolog n=1 Tax=Anaerotalea alkaliphila TaxID=2662126 RepID=A0A7X5KNU7_9FIRM|nr:response regulator transcription factor [Anaerotalea alkaliphila]NDL67112.1 response regulator transcription factor [Anaerotalea alkaliphila]